MVVSCPTCTTSYQIPDDSLRDRNATFRCEACGNTWVEAAQSARNRPQMNIAKLVGAPQSPPTNPDEDSPSQVARRVPRGGDRDRRDMFATPEPAPSSTANVDSVRPNYGFTATRNENSVLFNVNDLKAAAAARVSTPPPAAPAAAPSYRAQANPYAATVQHPEYAPISHGYPPPPPSSLRAFEDEIDIGSMLAQGGQVRSRMAIFQDEPRSSQMSMSISVPPPANTNKRLATLAVFAGGALCLLGVGMGVALKSDGATTKAAAAQLNEPRPLTTTSNAIVTTPETPVAPTPAPSASTEVAANPTQGGRTKGNRNPASPRTGARASSVGGSAPRTGTAPPPASPKKSDPCGCHGNLQCAMKCGL